MKLRVFVDDIAACTKGRKTELAVIQSLRKVPRAMRSEVEKGLKQSITEGGKKGVREVWTS